MMAEPDGSVPREQVNLADIVIDLTGASPTDDETKKVVTFMDWIIVPRIRISIPANISGDNYAYLTGLSIRRQYLKDFRLSGTTLMCLAEPAENGFIEMVPWEIFELLHSHRLTEPVATV